MDRIDDQIVIKEIATADNTDFNVRIAAVRKLLDEKTLRTIAEKDTNKEVSAEASERIRSIRSNR